MIGQVTPQMKALELEYESATIYYVNICLKIIYGGKLVQNYLNFSYILRDCEAKLKKNNQRLLDRFLFIQAFHIFINIYL